MSEIGLAINATAALIELLIKWQATRPAEYSEHAEEVAALRDKATRLKALPVDYLEKIVVKRT